MLYNWLRTQEGRFAFKRLALNGPSGTPREPIVQDATVVTAQDKFSNMLREEMAPALRRLGAKGSGHNYVMPDPDYFLCIGFQKDRYSTVDRVSFTVDLAAINRREWEQGWQPSWGKAPTATSVKPVGRYTRLGLLTPQQEDIWWAVTAETDTRSLAEEVVTAIRDYGLPGLQSAKAGSVIGAWFGATRSRP